MTPRATALWLAVWAALGGGPALAADTYVSDPHHTFASFEFNHLGYSTQRGRFDTVRATVVLDRENRTGSVEATLDAASVSTGSPSFNDTLRGAAYFDAAQFPDIVFSGRDLTFDKFDHIASVAGQLTIKGVTRPITLQLTQFKCMVHPLLRREACGANATASLRRSDFGLGKFAPLVGDQVTLHLAIEAVKQ